MKVKELIEHLQNLVKEEPEIADLEVLTPRTYDKYTVITKDEICLSAYNEYYYLIYKRDDTLESLKDKIRRDLLDEELEEDPSICLLIGDY